MDARNLPEALSAIMYERSWSQERLASELGVTQAWVSQAAHGKRDPGISATTDLLARVGWEVRIAPNGKDDPVNRREFVGAAASVMFVPSPTASVYQGAEYVRNLASRLAYLRDEQGGVPLMPKALQYVKRVEGALQSRDTELQKAASSLAQEAALVFHDGRYEKGSESAGRLALALAERAGNLNAQANAYNSLSLFSNYWHHGNRGAMYAREGLRLPELTDAKRVQLRVRLARSMALMQGQERKSRALLDQALSGDGLSPFHAAMVVGDVGVALGDLGAFHDAAAHLDQAVRLLETQSPLLPCLYLGRQIKAALRASEVSMAAERMQLLSRMAPLVASSRLDKQVRDIFKASTPYAHASEMKEARERLRDISSSSGAVSRP